MARALLLTAMILLAGCVRHGPAALEGQRIDYNLAIQRANDEQLLLNLVRLRYHESPFFLEVKNLSSQMLFQQELSAGWRWLWQRQYRPTLADNESANIGVKGIYSERPTISYAPLSGDDYIRSMLSPISTERLLLLNSSGWNLDRVMRLAVTSLNGVRNAPSASGPTPSGPPVFQDFMAAAEMLPDLQRRGLVTLTYQKSKQGPQLVLEFTKNGKKNQAVRKFRRHLNLPRKRQRFVLSPSAVIPGQGEYLNIQTRSLMGILFFLSQGIQVPAADASEGRVTVTRLDSGEVFDWNKVIGDLFRVHTSDQAPAHAAVAIQHRGFWYYIDDRDLESKATFALLAQLTTLQAGRAKDTGPVLTLPVGGG